MKNEEERRSPRFIKAGELKGTWNRQRVFFKKASVLWKKSRSFYSFVCRFLYPLECSGLNNNLETCYIPIALRLINFESKRYFEIFKLSSFLADPQFFGNTLAKKRYVSVLKLIQRKIKHLSVTCIINSERKRLLILTWNT